MGARYSCIVAPEPVYDSDEFKVMFPVINNIFTLKKYIDYAKKHEHLRAIKKDFAVRNIIDVRGMLSVSLYAPFNVFAQYAAGLKYNCDTDQTILGRYAEKFMICHNLVENDLNWYNPDFITGAMAGPDDNGPGHVFLTTKNLTFDTFNILPIILQKNGDFIGEILEAAIMYTTHRGWVNPGYYFHCYPHNSVQSLHLHIVNKDTAGPGFARQANRNLSIWDAIWAIHFEE
jgi:hypothetical protein